MPELSVSSWPIVPIVWFCPYTMPRRVQIAGFYPTKRQSGWTMTRKVKIFLAVNDEALGTNRQTAGRERGAAYFGLRAL